MGIRNVNDYVTVFSVVWARGVATSDPERARWEKGGYDTGVVVRGINDRPPMKLGPRSPARIARRGQ